MWLKRWLGFCPDPSLWLRNSWANGLWSSRIYPESVWLGLSCLIIWCPALPQNSAARRPLSSTTWDQNHQPQISSSLYNLPSLSYCVISNRRHMADTMKTELHMDLKPVQREHTQHFHVWQTINMLNLTQQFSGLEEWPGLHIHPSICFQLCA